MDQPQASLTSGGKRPLRGLLTKPQFKEAETGGSCGVGGGAGNVQKAVMHEVWRQKSKDSFKIYF